MPESRSGRAAVSSSPAATSGLAASASQPRLRRRPRQRREVDRLLGVDRRGRADRGDVDENVPEPRPAHRQRGREQHALVVLARERAEPGRDVHVGRREDPRGVEHAQQARGREREAGVERIGGGHAVAPSSSTSLSAATSAPGGRQAKTPAGSPPATGVSAPVMPRRNR